MQEAAVGAVHSAPGFRPKTAVAQSICHLSFVICHLSFVIGCGRAPSPT
jgi:hypothetical protein